MKVTLGLTGTDAIAQSLRTIILTSRGEVPFRPSFGLNVQGLLGTHNDSDVVSALIEQVHRYEKRIKVDKIKVSSPTLGALTINLQYTVKATGEKLTLIQTKQ